MNLTELKTRLEAEMAAAEKLLSPIEGIEFTATVEVAERSSYIFGAVMLTTPEIPEKERVYIALEADTDINNEVDEEKFEAECVKFRARLENAVARLAVAENKTEVILAIGKEIDAEMDAEIEAELAALDRSTKGNLKVALIAAALLAVAALVCVLIEKLV